MTYGKALVALADPTRRSVLERLRRADASVQELADTLPVTRSAVSQHLKVLKDAGLVVERRQGRQRIYRVNPPGLVALRRYLDGYWGDVLAAFEEEARRHPTKRRKETP